MSFIRPLHFPQAPPAFVKFVISSTVFNPLCLMASHIMFSVIPKQVQTIFCSFFSVLKSSRSTMLSKFLRASSNASYPITEQCIFSGGKPPNWSAMSLFVIFFTSSTVLPIIISVKMLELATAEPHPKVWNFASVTIPFLIFKYIFNVSPQANEPASPIASALSIFPTFLGFL